MPTSTTSKTADTKAAGDQQAPGPTPAPPSVKAPSAGDVDRSVYVGPINARDPEVKTPENYADASKAPKGKEVDVFQVLASSNAVLLRFDNVAHLLNDQQAAALGKDLDGARMNVTY